jgi:hypothetical protein
MGYRFGLLGVLCWRRHANCVHRNASLCRGPCLRWTGTSGSAASIVLTNGLVRCRSCLSLSTLCINLNGEASYVTSTFILILIARAALRNGFGVLSSVPINGPSPLVSC